MNIGNCIKSIRILCGLSQQSLADDLYVTQQAVQQWEKSKTFPQIDKLLDISDACQVPLLECIYSNSHDRDNICEISVDISGPLLQTIEELQGKQHSGELSFEDKFKLAFGKHCMQTGHHHIHILLSEYESELFKSMKAVNPLYTIDEFLDFLHQGMMCSIRSG